MLSVQPLTSGIEEVSDKGTLALDVVLNLVPVIGVALLAFLALKIKVKYWKKHQQSEEDSRKLGLEKDIVSRMLGGHHQEN